MICELDLFGLPTPCPWLRGHYFENLVRSKMPQVHYRLALLQVMLSFVKILGSKERNIA